MNNIKKKKIKVYISSPYSLGDKLENVKRQIKITDILFDNGFYPFTPLYSHYQNEYKQRDWEEWIDYDLVWVGVCDCLLRIKPIINGEELKSNGSDAEEFEAKRLNKPIFYSIEELINYYK